MGLDIYFYAFPKGTLDDSTDITCTLRSDLEWDMFEIKYYRKWHELNRYMVILYDVKGGTDDFNCGVLKITLDDIKRIRDTMKVGQDNKSYQRSINQLCTTVAKYIRGGYDVYYHASW